MYGAAENIVFAIAAMPLNPKIEVPNPLVKYSFRITAIDNWIYSSG
jgi:hypothetical protein